jgi:hypothetical protein
MYSDDKDNQWTYAGEKSYSARHRDESGNAYYYSSHEDETADRRTYLTHEEDAEWDEWENEEKEDELYYTSTGSARFVHVCGRGESNEECNSRCDCLGGRFHVAQPTAAMMAVVSLITVMIAITVACFTGRYLLGARQMQLEHAEEVKKMNRGRRYDDTVNVLNTDAPAPMSQNVNRSGRRNQVAPRSASPSPAPPAAYVVDGTVSAEAEQQKMAAYAAAYNHVYAMQMQQQRDAMARRQAAQAESNTNYGQGQGQTQVLHGQFVPHSQAQAEYPQSQMNGTYVVTGEPVIGGQAPQQYH